MKRTKMEKKRHEHWIEEAQSYILETRYSINKPNLEYEANNEKLTENTERKKTNFGEKTTTELNPMDKESKMVLVV